MVNPINATPILREQDLVEFAKSLFKTSSEESVKKRSAARSLLKRVTN